MAIPPRIRITGVHVHRLRGALRERFGWSLNWTTSRSATLVEVTTDADLTGWGDGNIDVERLQAHPELVIGRSPFEVEAIYEELRAPGVRQRRLGEPTSAGLDIALWDLVGQALGVPVSRLLGRVHRTRVEAYCTALYRKDWPDLAQGLAEEARQWKAAGYSAIKMKIGYEPDLDYRIARAVREAIGDDCALGVDSNCAYDASTAMALGRRLEELNLMWWEEPLAADDLEGYRALKQALRIPMASGETESADWLIANYIQPRLIDVVQPDLDTVGLTGARALTYLCWLNRLRLVPHNWGTAIRTAATLHWMACCPPLTAALNPPRMLFEFDRTEHPFRDAVIAERIDIDPADGCVSVPQGPGLGVTVQRDAVAAFRTELIRIGDSSI